MVEGGENSWAEAGGYFERKVLRRWRAPSFLEALRQPGVGRLLLCTVCLFFKYRILNKFFILMDEGSVDNPQGGGGVNGSSENVGTIVSILLDTHCSFNRGVSF